MGTSLVGFFGPSFYIGTRSQTIEVGLDVKPGNGLDRIALAGEDALPVALLSTMDFDATARVDRSSLTFGCTGDEPSLIRCKEKPTDVNGDGLADLTVVKH